MRIVKIIISCWPTFQRSATQGMRESLRAFAGDRCLEVLDTHDGMGKVPCYQFERNDFCFIIVPSSHCYLSISKNQGVNSFNGCELKKQEIADCEGVLFMDADHSFVWADIARLLLGLFPVVGAAYHYRSGPWKGERFVAGTMADNGFITNRVLVSARGIHEVDWVGGGFLYVSSWVFGEIEYPWFRRGVIDIGSWALELGEDIGFCLQCNKAGIVIGLDCICQVGHGERCACTM